MKRWRRAPPCVGAHWEARRLPAAFDALRTRLAKDQLRRLIRSRHVERAAVERTRQRILDVDAKPVLLDHLVAGLCFVRNRKADGERTVARVSVAPHNTDTRIGRCP